MQHLIHILSHGYAYDRTNEDGTVERILVSPNRYMISAAKRIDLLTKQLDAAHYSLEVERNRVIELEQQAEKYRQTIKGLENASTKNDKGDNTCATAGPHLEGI